jgi:hypothetical protein
VGGDTDIHRAAIAIGHHINPSAAPLVLHAALRRKKRDPGSSPG